MNWLGKVIQKLIDTNVSEEYKEGFKNGFLAATKQGISDAKMVHSLSYTSFKEMK